MKIIKVLFVVILAVLFHGCENSIDNEQNNEVNSLMNEIELLSLQGIDIPEVVTDNDIEKCRDAISMAQAVGNIEIELQCRIRLVELLSKAENFTEALDNAKDALELAVESEDKNLIAVVYRLIGESYYDLASFHNAFENLEIALKLFNELNDTVNIQDVMNIQGNIYFSYRDYDMAYSYYKQNLEISKLRNDNVSITKALTNIGLIYSNRSMEEGLSQDSIDYLYEKSLEYINNALLFNRKTNSRLVTAEILFNLADVYRGAGNYEDALKHIKQALEISKPISERVYIWSSVSYANILLEIDSINEAETVLLNSLSVAEKYELKESLINIYSLLSQIYNEKEDYKLAYKYYTEYSYLTQEVFTIGYKKQIDAVKLTSEMEADEKLEKVQSRHRFLRNILILSILIAGLIISILIYLRLRQRSANISLENKLLNERLETRNRELTLRIMALIQRNEVEKEIVQKLNGLKLKLKKEYQKEIADILSSLSFKQNDLLWKEFEIRFENVHQDFFSKLSKLYPELTTNEKRLCAFLYLDMSSKDISAITGQSIRALNVARTRLRKRFNLTNDSQTISAFLNSL